MATAWILFTDSEEDSEAVSSELESFDSKIEAEYIMYTAKMWLLDL